MESSTVYGGEYQMWLSYSWHSIHHSTYRLRGNGQREQNNANRLHYPLD